MSFNIFIFSATEERVEDKKNQKYQLAHESRITAWNANDQNATLTINNAMNKKDI
jgi:hypothetical protein